MDISRIEANKLNITLETVSLKPFLKDLQNVLMELAHQKNVTLSFNIQEGLNGIKADPVRLKQIFINLISNAIKFNRENGRVWVNVHQSEGGCWIHAEVRDTGIGIPKEKMRELFSEFYQVDDSLSRRYEGTGLGLALTRKQIHLHGGDIRVESEEGVGSTFSFKLPVEGHSDLGAPGHNGAN